MIDSRLSRFGDGLGLASAEKKCYVHRMRLLELHLTAALREKRCQRVYED